MLHLQRHLVPLIRAASYPSTSATSSSLRLRIFLSTATPFSVEEYLVATCGLTGAQALTASKKLPNLKSASNPDAVVALLSGAGLSRADVAAVVAANPSLLQVRAGNLARRLDSLRGRVGLHNPEIARFLLAGGATGIRLCDVAPRVEFWIPFAGSFDTFLRILRRNNRILTMNLEKVAKPNIALLRECGLSVRDIVKMALSSRLLTFNPERVKGFVRRADELGVPRGSAAFKCTVGIASCISEEKVAAKLEVVRNTLGCSTERLCSEVCKRPQILALSEEQLCRKIEFLVTEVGLQPEYILKRLVLLTFSLEKRLMPRHCVLKVLEAKGLMKEGLGFCPIILYGEDDFVARYIDCHKGTVPGLADAYAAARAGEITPKVNL